MRLPPRTLFLWAIGTLVLCAGGVVWFATSAPWLEPEAHRAVASLPAGFWAQLLSAVAVFLGVAGMLSFRPGTRAVRLWVGGGLVLSTFGLAAALGHALEVGPRWPGLTIIALQLAFALLAVGAYRESLFQIDRWLWGTWVFFGVSVLTLLLDLLVVYLLDIKSERVLLVSVMLLAWLYFPIRQALWRRWSGRLRQGDFRELLPTVVADLLSMANSNNPAASWMALLDRLLAPLNVERRQLGSPDVVVREGGAELHVPSVARAPAVVLRYADRGSRLFSANDQRFVAALVEIAGRIIQERDAARSGATEERRRIGADLHDHVVPSLLSFIYCAGDDTVANSGRAAMRELRTVIQSLGEITPHRDDLS